MTARTPMTIDNIPESYAGTVLDIASLHAFDFTNGMTAPASGNIVFRVKNPTVGAITITVASTAIGGRADIAFQAKSLAASADVILPVFKAVGWAQASDGLLHFDCSATGLTYQALLLPTDV